MNNCDNYSDREFVELLLCTLDGAVNEEQFNSLQKQIVSNGDAQELYYDFLITYAGLSRFGKSHTSLNRPDPASEYDDLLALMAKHERTAPETIIPKVEPPRELIQKVVYPPREKRKMSKFGIFTLVTSAAAILFVVLFAKFAPVENSYHATLVDSFNAQWGNTSKPAGTGSQLSLYDGDRWLQGGYVKLLFDSGAEVVIESPARFEILSDNELNVLSGRAYSTVPKRAKGFMVYTPNSTVIDLGTEFGIEVLEDSSSVHMIKGKASVLPDSRLHAQKPIELITGHAKRFSQNGIIRDIRIDEVRFASDISSKMKMIYRTNKAISVGTWDGRLAPDLEKDLHTDGRLVHAVNLGPQPTKSVTVCGISLGPLPQGGIVSDGEKLQVTDPKFYEGPDDGLKTLLATSRRISNKSHTRIRINMKDLKIGQTHRIQLIMGFPWLWCDVNCYGVNNDHLYFSNVMARPELALVSYRWIARSSNEKITLCSPPALAGEPERNAVHVFGYVLHEVKEGDREGLQKDKLLVKD